MLLTRMLMVIERIDDKYEHSMLLTDTDFIRKYIMAEGDLHNYGETAKKFKALDETRKTGEWSEFYIEDFLGSRKMYRFKFCAGKDDLYRFIDGEYNTKGPDRVFSLAEVFSQSKSSLECLDAVGLRNPPYPACRHYGCIYQSNGACMYYRKHREVPDVNFGKNCTLRKASG